MTPLDFLCQYAMQFVNAPYRWGGKGPAYDCSGYCTELLKAVGLAPPHECTAQQIFEYLKPICTFGAQQRGAFAFYGQSTNTIVHVGFLITDFQIIEARGGSAATTTADAAQSQSAFVGVRLLQDKLGVSGRRDLVATLLPPLWASPST